jgi:Tol biopolymer transport system component
MTLAPGTKLGPYEIVSPLGAGGMGEVYRAKDARLGRDVAVKVLPERLAEDADALARFEREAKAVAALSHPNILALHDVGREGRVAYAVMELLEGETLRQELASGPLAPRRAVDCGVQIAHGLAAAHEKGIVHRDLKPDNVFVTRDDRVKILDFGLAKPGAGTVSGSETESPTVSGYTEPGKVMGTVGYMSPEQVRGGAVDQRSDIFSFGSMLYEMLTGRRAFQRETAAETMTAILNGEPPEPETPGPTIPDAIRPVLRHCLEKKPEKRFQSVRDLAFALETATAPESGSRAERVAPRESRVNLGWLAAAILALAVALLAVLLVRKPAPAAGDLTRFVISPPPGHVFFGVVSMSPDARRILFLLHDDSGRTSIAMRALDSLEMKRLPGTDDARGILWSPDGREIGFFHERHLKRMAADGGPVQTVCESGGAFFGSWGRDGTILFASAFYGPIVAVSASGGTPRPVTVLDSAAGDIGHLNPSFLPDGRHFVYAAINLNPEKTAVFLGSLDSKEHRKLFLADSSAFFAEPGYLLFGRDGAMFAWRFDPKTLALQGDPAPVFDRVRVLREDGDLAASTAGNRVVYLSWPGLRRLVWVDRKGTELATLGDAGGYSDVRISPDGRRVAVARRDPAHGQNQDLWVLDANRGTASRVTGDPGEEFDPAWFPDGERLVYVSSRAGFYDLYESPASGGATRTLLQNRQDKVLPVVAPGGADLLYALDQVGIGAIFKAPISNPSAATRLTPETGVSELHPAVSPDGRWLAFDSNETGREEVYVRPLSGGPKRQISIGGGQLPVWNPKGTELFYAARDGRLTSVDVRAAGGGIESSEPQPLFELALGTTGELPWLRHPYDVSPDGQRFLIIRRSPDVEPDAAVLVTDWTKALRRAS